MASYTKNYNAKKPAQSENYDVDIANFNNDLWDEKIFGKQDKIAGKSLSTNDFTNEYKTKLDNLQNYNDTQLKEKISSIENKDKQQDAETDKIKQEQTTQNTNIESNKTKISALETDNTKNKKEIEDNKTNIANNKNNIETNKSEIEELKLKNDKLKQENYHLINQIPQRKL